MPLPVTFGSLAGTIPLADLDLNFAAVGVLGTLPCAVAGTNALALALTANTPTISAYADYMRFSATAVNDNTGAVTAQVGALPAINVYKDGINGPEALSGGEIQAGNSIVLTYDAALNSGNGGFHLETGSAVLKGQTINPGAIFLGLTGSTLSAMIKRTAALAFTLAAANTTQDVTATLAGVSLGDFVLVSPPSIAMAAGAVYSGWVPAAGTLAVRQANILAATIGTINGTFGLTAFRLA